MLQPEDLITAKEAAQMLTVSQQTAYRWLDEGVLTGFKRGHTVRISRISVEAVLRGEPADDRGGEPAASA